MTTDADAPEAAEPLQTAPEAQETDRTLVFEQPLSERMRTFLRLDFLYSQALYHNEMASEWGTRAAVTSLIDILAIITRSDVRSDALKELERQLTALGEFQSKPGVDTNRLKSLIGNVTRLRGELMNAGVANLQPLKESDFLNAIKHRSSIPGGTCEFDLPDYLFWLSQPDEVRARAFNQWLAVLRPLCDAVAELIWLTRQNGRTRQETAPGGSFTITFERENPLQLLRIALPASTGLYPEVSGSHHRCNVRFLSWKGLSERPTQAVGDVKFLLTCCN
ncbi:MAG TPA: cell division protein ZapD [Steroidobacteraceae bacterium]|nr:cell division protein ZapD [Steroidobacteraceae bacterium]